MKKLSLFLVVFSVVFLLSCGTDEYDLISPDGVANNLSESTAQAEVQAASVVYYLSAGTTDQTAEFQSLINSMNANDELILGTGNHYLASTVHVNKSYLTITGEEGCIIRKSGSVSCIDIDESSNYTIIDNLYIDGGNMSEPCMRVFSNGNTILNSTFRNSGNSGLLMHTSHLNVIEGCKFYYNYMVGLSQWKSSDNEIRYCQMYENGAEGITVDGDSHNSIIHHNWVHKNNLPVRGVGGIGIDASNGTQIYHNTIDYNGVAGIKFQNNLCGGCDGATIYSNENISYNDGAAIVKRFNDQPISNLGIYDNTMTGNTDGEVLVDSSTAPCNSY